MITAQFEYVVIHVRGGIADIADRSGVCVVIIDYDNDSAGEVSVYDNKATEPLTRAAVLEALDIEEPEPQGKDT